MNGYLKLPALLESLLKETSRAFYLSLSLLPPGPRLPISMAYLLARSADSIADEPQLEPHTKRHLLSALKDAIERHDARCPDGLSDLELSSPSEERLLAILPESLALFSRLPSDQRALVSEVVATLIEGMLWDQELFEDGGPVQGLEAEELEKYTYLVAGCVGPFWSRTLQRFDERLSRLTAPDELETAVEFGRALQYINILRDIPEDQVEGRYYLPLLESPAFDTKFCKVGHRCLSALSAASCYPTWFRASQLRERICSLLPLILGFRTLEKLFAAGKPQRGQRVKVSRREVWLWLLCTLALGWCNGAVKAALSHLQGRAAERINAYERGSR